MKIGVIGLGLIGGSIFKELKQKRYDVVGVSRTVKEADVTNDYNSLIGCDLVFLCVPMNKTLEILDKLNQILSEETTVVDVCSLKCFVAKKSYNFNFIPSHPMAGTEHSGWDNSFIGLFKGTKWAITPIDGNITSAQELLETIMTTHMDKR